MLGPIKEAWAVNEEDDADVATESMPARAASEDVDAVHPFSPAPSAPHAKSANPMTPVQVHPSSSSADSAGPKCERIAQRGCPPYTGPSSVTADTLPPLLPSSVRAVNQQLENLSEQQQRRNGESQPQAVGGRSLRMTSAPSGRSPSGLGEADPAPGRQAAVSTERKSRPSSAAAGDSPPSRGRRSLTPPVTRDISPRRQRSPASRRAMEDGVARSGPSNGSAEAVGAPPRRTASPKTRDGRIRVVVRKRPLNAQEGGVDCIAVDAPNLTMSVTKQRLDLSEYTEKNDFSFDDVFSELTSNESIYKSCAQELLSVALHGGSASCFAYGQTGSGKTYTMMGGGTEKGLYLLAAHDLFERASANHAFSVGFYEIYCNSLFDLLNRRAPVVIREDGNRRMNLRGLTWNAIESPEQLWRLVSAGLEQRVTGSTSANERSSRSHAVLSIRVADLTDPELSGVLNFVDLAGSERAADTANNDKQTRLEGAEINKSLLALKECIRSLDEKKKHVPFRGSKLTEVLRDSFTGNSKTLMIANVSPSSLNSEHTANTLRYAFRVKGLSIAMVAPSKERHVPRPAARARSAQPLREAVEVGEEANTSPSASPTPAQRLQGGPAAKKRRLRSRPNGAVASPATAPAHDHVPASRVDEELVCEELSDDDVEKVEAVALQPGGDSSGADTAQLEYRLKKKIMAQLQRDLGREIQQVLDERDAIIASLRQENDELRARVSHLSSQKESLPES